MQLRKREKQWQVSEEVTSKYAPFTSFDLGRVCVSPNKIIGLTFPVGEIRHDSKMESLRQSVSSHGWNDKCPGDLHLYLLPDGNYTVATGGNHRSYLSNELNIDLIEAVVSVLIPFSLIPEDIQEKHEYFYAEYDRYNEKAVQLNRDAQSTGRYVLNDDEYNLYMKYSNTADKMLATLDEILLKLAKELKFIP